MNWMTLKEVADHLKLSRMMIYKLAQQGVIPVAKVGRVWRFEMGAVDEWMMGSKKNKGNAVVKIVENFCAQLRVIFGENYGRVILFGSCARGDARDDSDIDVLVVLNAIEDYIHVRSQVENAAYDVTFGSGIARLLAPVIVDEREYLIDASPLMLNVRKEGKMAA